MQFKRLGLVIIDEEHRFGVRQKEALKALRAEVDVLTLTATPIPRTLGMALEGLRDFSVIATAPQKRLAIKTFVRREEDGVIREAMLRELKRGGQVYFLHNEVETIENRRTMLEALVPEARIAVAHGQMHERELERVMRDFVGQRANVLLCTTIIETGIDVPSANTILLHRADKFGLAQLHQLRGRVGRSHHQAYAYLLVHDPAGLTKQAQRRLEAIQQMEELGSGFYLAMHDLEIRGTGEVLGDKQSGEIQEIGFQLYTDMLNDAVKALKEGREPDLTAPLAATTEINLHAPAILPADYCGDVQERLSLYKRLANCESQRFDRRHPGGTHRPLRQVAAAGACAGGDASIAARREAARHREDRRGRVGDRAAVHPESARRRDEDHRDGAEAQAHQARGAGQAQDRDAQPGSVGADCDGQGDAARARRAGAAGGAGTVVLYARWRDETKSRRSMRRLFVFLTVPASGIRRFRSCRPSIPSSPGCRRECQGCAFRIRCPNSRKSAYVQRFAWSVRADHPVEVQVAG